MTAARGRGHTKRAISHTAFRDGGFGPRYEAGAPLGEGGMSQVVRVFDRARGEHVALKVLNRAASSVTLGSEFRYIASLNHPGVVSVYDFGATPDGQPFFTMELLSEGDLLDLAERASLAATLRAVREVFRTLDFVHARGVVHADLKPSNILLGRTRSGQLYPKILDFGIAWQQAAEQRGGTPQYMAPELFVGGERDHRSDLYAMGVVLFEVLTAELPFDEPNIVGLAQRHMTTPAPDPRDVNPALPGELAELILRLLEKQPRDRFQNAREVVRALDAYLKKEDAPPSRAEPHEVAEPQIAIAGGSRFVGPQAELEALLERAGELERGGAVYLVAGEPGAGKTRLLTELRVGAQLKGLGCLAVDLESCRAAEEVIDRLAAALSNAGAGPVARAAILAEEAVGGDRFILEAERLAGVAIALAGRAPLLLGIENVEALSAEAGKALRAFALGVRDGAIMLVATARAPDEGAAAELGAIEGAELIELRRVSREACAEIIRSLLGELEGARAIVEHVYRESGGNPGAIARAVQALVASEAIVLRGNIWVVSAERGGELPVLSTEEGLRTIAAALVARLGEREREVASAAAMIGEQLDAELVAALAGGDELHESLRELVACQVLEPVDEGADAAWTRFRFCQRAIRDVLYEAMPAASAREHSRRLVELLERRQAEGAGHDPEVLARHLLALGESMRAAEVAAAAISSDGRPSAALVEVLRRALGPRPPKAAEAGRWCELAKLLADIDRQQGRGDEAIAGYRRVAERAPAAAGRLKAAARRELGDLLMSRGEENGEAVLRGALEQARALRAPDLVGRAAYALADRLVLAGRYDEASSLLTEALRVSEEIGDRLLRAQTLKLYATLNWLGGTVEESVSYARAAVDEYRKAGSLQGIAVSLGALANALFDRGEMSAAREAYTEALEHARQAGWLTGIRKLEAGLAAVAWHNDDWDGACEHLEAAIAIGIRTGDQVAQLVHMYGMGWIAASRGDTVAATNQNKRALQLARKAKYAKGEADALTNLGALSLEAGALDEAEAYLIESRAIAERAGATSSLIETEHRLLELALARHEGPLAIAERAEELLKQAEEASVRRELPHIRRVAGVAYARAREPGRAKEELDAAREAFEALGSRYEAACTVRIMAELVAIGLLHDDRMEVRLREACRIFRKLRAQPQLDAARRIRERLGMPPSSRSLRSMTSSAPRISSADTPPPRSSVKPSATPPPSTPPTARQASPVAATSPAQPEMRGSLVDVSRELSEILELDQLLARVIDAAIATSDAERGFVIVCDRNGQPTMRVSRGLGGVSLDEDLEMSRSAVGRAIATRQRVEWRNDAPPRAELGDSVTLLGLQAVVALPLTNRGQLLGVLYVDTRNPRSRLIGSAGVPLDALAAQAAVAIHNAQLFEELGRKNELMAAAINQLRHPLDALQRCADLATKQASGSRAAQLNETVRSHAKRLSGMVSRLLELAAAEPSKVSGSKVSVQVHDLVDAAVLQLQPLADIAEVPFEIDVPWGLPTILGHREQLIQMLVSMLGTALRRSASGQSVWVKATTVESPPSSRDSDPFFPPSDRELYGDNGIEIEVSFTPSGPDAEPLDELGLAITREIVEHHGGSWASWSDFEIHRLVAVLPSLMAKPSITPASR